MEGYIVRSVAGRDRGKFMVVVGYKGDYPLVCDGKERPTERPKRKNPKHLKFTNTHLEKAQYATNKSLRRTLKAFTEKEND